MILLGAPLPSKPADPEAWATLVKSMGYRAAYCPVALNSDAATIAAYAAAADRHGIVIAEVGAWSNPLADDPAERKAAREKCMAALALADAIGARCAVNITGSRGRKWDGPDPRNLTSETFDMIVQCTREIIDTVKPRRACYTLETMPWMYPDSVDSYVRLLDAIDRPAAAAHFDPVNLVCSPQTYFGNAGLIRDFVQRLGPRLKSSHGKDTLLDDKLTTHLSEVRPGLGYLDYATFLRALDGLPGDTPLMLEHLPTPEDYVQTAEHVRAVARREGVSL